MVPNARQCTICGASADKMDYGYQCQAIFGHVGDLYVGIFTDLTYPGDHDAHEPAKERSIKDNWKS